MIYTISHELISQEVKSIKKSIRKEFKPKTVHIFAWYLQGNKDHDKISLCVPYQVYNGMDFIKDDYKSITLV